MIELDKIIDQLSKLTVIEASNLAKRLEDVWGVTTSNNISSVAVSQKNDNNIKTEEKLQYDIILESHGDKKINIIKEVKMITGLGLKAAKELVDSVPKTIKSSVEKSEAEKLKVKLEAIGAKVSLK